MMPAERVLECLEGVRRTAPGRWLARCPAHDDRSPSLSIRELDDGRMLLHDFAGCSTRAVLNALGLDLSDLFPEPVDRSGHGPTARSTFAAADALRALSAEVTVLVMVSRTLLDGRALPDVDHARLVTAAERIRCAAALCRALP